MFEIGSIIKNQRMVMGLSIQQIAEIVNVQAGQYAALEIDEAEFDNVELNLINKICKVLEIDLYRLLNVNYPIIENIEWLKNELKTLAVKGSSSEETIEDLVGWEFVENLDNINNMREYPILFYKDLGIAINKDWEIIALLYLT